LRFQPRIGAVERRDHVAAGATGGMRVERRGEGQTLKEGAVVTRRPELRFGELACDVLARAAFARAARQPARKRIVGEISNVGERAGGATDDIGGCRARLTLR